MEGGSLSICKEGARHGTVLCAQEPMEARPALRHSSKVQEDGEDFPPVPSSIEGDRKVAIIANRNSAYHHCLFCSVS